MPEPLRNFKTADLYDQYADRLQVGEPVFTHYGGRKTFAGPMATVKCFEDNSYVKKLVSRPGEGRVLVVDAGGSLRCAMLGDRLAETAVNNGWAGVVLYGCIRDADEISAMALGVMALATNPRKSVKKDCGESGLPISFAGVCFRPGEWLYADPDGLVVAAEQLFASA